MVSEIQDNFRRLTYLEQCHKSAMEYFGKIVKGTSTDI